MCEIITSLQAIHKGIKPAIEERLLQFKENDTVEKIQKEFFFCLLTPQCKARVCWDNIERLFNNGIMIHGSEEEISGSLTGVRFRNNKAGYIVESRKRFFSGDGSFLSYLKVEKDEKLLRRYIAENVKGMGYKEASHFLRNIGRGSGLAILDRHILRGLVTTEVIKRIPSSLSAGKYVEVENAMGKFAENINIPMAHLDFVFWYFFNKEVFK